MTLMDCEIPGGPGGAGLVNGRAPGAASEGGGPRSSGLRWSTLDVGTYRVCTKSPRAVVFQAFLG